MRFRAAIFLALAAGFGVAASSVLGEEIPKSDRWFSVVNVAHPERRGYLHIALAPSGSADAPVRAVYDRPMLYGRERVSMHIEALSLNDEWRSPVRLSMNLLFGEKTTACEIQVARPDPNSAAGTMVRWEEGVSTSSPLKAHAVLRETVLDLVCRRPFDKAQTLDFAEFDVPLRATEDLRLSYAGEEELERSGQKRTLHKFVVTAAGSAGPRETYWLTDGHELVQAQVQNAAVQPASETDARMPVAQFEADQLGEKENARRMAEGVAGCAAIAAALRAQSAQTGAFPTLNAAGGDELPPALQLAPHALDGRNFKPADYAVTSSPAAFTIKAVMGAQSYVADEKGVESGTYRLATGN